MCVLSIYLFIPIDVEHLQLAAERRVQVEIPGVCLCTRSNGRKLRERNLDRDRNIPQGEFCRAMPNVLGMNTRNMHQGRAGARGIDKFLQVYW